jgi:FkbM family methyltransferase
MVSTGRYCIFKKMKKFKYNNKEIYFWSRFDNDHIYKRIKKYNNFYEINLLEKISTFNLSGTYVDIGSNIGNHTIYFALFTNSERVVSIEIHPEIYEILLKNIELNPSEKYHPINIGVGDKTETILLSKINDDNVGMTHIINEFGDVVVKKLDDILCDFNNISLIKIDVEGYELKVLHGAKDIIKKNKPVLIVECRGEEEFKNINSFLMSLNYETNKINYAKTPTYIWICK